MEAVEEEVRAFIQQQRLPRDALPHKAQLLAAGAPSAFCSPVPFIHPVTAAPPVQLLGIACRWTSCGSSAASDGGLHTVEGKFNN